MATTDSEGTPRKGRAGAYTYYQRNGQRIMRIADRTKKANEGRTRRSLEHKTTVINVLNAWRAFDKQLVGNFEGRRAGQTDYNAFVGLNTPGARVYLSKDQVSGKCRVADRFIVSHGSLDPLPLEQREGLWLSDIAIVYPAVPEGTTVGDLSAAVLGEEGRFWLGDELVLYRTRNRPPITYGLTRVDSFDVLTLRLRLDPDDDTPLPSNLFSVSQGRLALPVEEASLVALVHRRGHRASTQTLQGDNPLLSLYTTPAAQEAAIESYGVRQH